MTDKEQIQIARLEVDDFDIRLRNPLLIASGAFDLDEGFLVRLVSAHGHIGIGEGTPCKETHDSKRQAFAELQSLHLKDIPGCLSTSEFFDLFLTRFSSNTLRNALDCAFHDLFARSLELPVFKLYREEPRRVPNCFTIGAQKDARSTKAEVRRVLSLFPHLEVLKLKLLGNDDVERCKAAFEVAGDSLIYALDANQGYADPELAVVEFRKIISTMGKVIAVEEPCPRGELDKMRYVTEQLSDTDVFADESCIGESDLDSIIAEKAARGINIKLQKAGGITAARRMSEKAAQFGIKVMVGCMVEIPQAIAAGVHFAVSDDNVILTDLDSDFYIEGLDSGRLPFEKGARHPLLTPGFGSYPKESELSEARQAGLLTDSAVLRLP